MTLADNKCECCGHDDLPHGVGSMVSAPMSIMWCSVCLLHGAEPKWAYETLFGTLPCAEAHEGLIYYDEATDSYLSVQTGEVVPVLLVDGTAIEKRASVVRHIKSRTPKTACVPETEFDLSGIDDRIQFEE